MRAARDLSARKREFVGIPFEVSEGLEEEICHGFTRRKWERAKMGETTQKNVSTKVGVEKEAEKKRATPNLNDRLRKSRDCLEVTIQVNQKRNGKRRDGTATQEEERMNAKGRCDPSCWQARIWIGMKTTE